MLWSVKRRWAGFAAKQGRVVCCCALGLGPKLADDGVKVDSSCAFGFGASVVDGSWF